MNNSIITDSNELIDILENERAFYEDWLALAQNCIPSFFSIRDGEVKFTNQYNFLSFSTKEIVSARINDMIHKHLNTTLASLKLSLNYDARDEVRAHFLTRLITQIQTGEITLPRDTVSKLEVIYTPKMSVAQACRILGLSRYAVNKLTERYTADIYRRYMALQAGQRYEHVMGDCAPYIHNQPEFTPMVRLDEGDPRAAALLVPGALVAEVMSERFYTVDHLGCSGGLVFTTDEIVHFPLKVLPVQYREVANRFCGRIMPARKRFAA